MKIKLWITLLSSLCLLCTPTTTVATEPSLKKPQISLQLWSIKDDISKDFEGSLHQVAAMGFHGVEFAGNFGPYANNPHALKKLLDELGLKAAGAHIGFDKVNEKNFYATVAFYQTLGCKNLIIPWDDRIITKAGALQVAVELRNLSGRLQSYGMRTGYHNHHEEMMEVEGKTIWEWIADATPNEVILQQDVGWTTYAGKDPIFYVKKYPGRTVLTHYKAKLPKDTSGTPIIGKDVIHWPQLYQANLDHGGTEWLTVEQEEYPNGMSPMESVKASFQGLRAVIENIERKKK
jgi:sugar phosphate isomerase/epimerase